MSKWIPVQVIDNDQIIRKVLRRPLKLYGFEVYPAENGQRNDRQLESGVRDRGR